MLCGLRSLRPCDFVGFGGILVLGDFGGFCGVGRW